MSSARLPGQWPNVVKATDPLALLSEQHEALRTVLDQMPLAVGDDGRGDPAEGRVLRAIVDRALVWHHGDEETVVLPRLMGLGHQLEEMCASCRQLHLAIKDASSDVSDLVSCICRDEDADPNQWREACEALRQALEPSMLFEDEALIPAARRLLDADDREDMAAELRARAEDRPELSELFCPPALPRRVSRVSTMRPAGAPDLVRRYVDCPRNRTAAIDVCASCPQAAAESDVALWCHLDQSPVSACVGDVMTRAVRCVSPEVSLTELVSLLEQASVSGTPVVDEHGQVLGVVSQTDLVRTMATARTLEGFRVADVMMRTPFCVDERTTIENAAALLAYEGVHRLPVVNAQHEVVGIISALDLVRWRDERSRDARGM